MLKAGQSQVYKYVSQTTVIKINRMNALGQPTIDTHVCLRFHLVQLKIFAEIICVISNHLQIIYFYVIYTLDQMWAQLWKLNVVPNPAASTFSGPDGELLKEMFMLFKSDYAILVEKGH